MIPIDKRKWARAVAASPDLTQATKRFAAWLITRPVKGTDNEFKSGQAAAAEALHLSVKTIHNAETKLVNAYWLRRGKRGARHRSYSTFVILDPEQHMQNLQVETGTKHELGGRLWLVPKPAKSSASMTTAPIRTNRNHDSDIGTRRADRHVRQGQRRIDEGVGRDYFVDATSRSVIRALRTVPA